MPVIVQLAAASIGAIFTSLAGDMGTEVSNIPEHTGCEVFKR